MKNPSLTKIIKLAENGHYHYTGNEHRLAENLKQLQRKHTEQIESLVSKISVLEKRNHELLNALSLDVPYSVVQEHTAGKKIKLTVSPSTKQIRVKFNDSNSDLVKKDVLDFINQTLIPDLEKRPFGYTLRGPVMWIKSLNKYRVQLCDNSKKCCFRDYQF